MDTTVETTAQPATAASDLVAYFKLYEAQRGRLRDSFTSPKSNNVETNMLMIPVPLLRALVAQHQDVEIASSTATRSELVVWTPVGEGMPDADLSVNITLNWESDELTWIGYFDGELWRDVEGMPVDVAAWAPMLKGMA